MGSSRSPTCELLQPDELSQLGCQSLFSSNESDIAVFAEFLRVIARLSKLKCLGICVEVHVEGEPWVTPGLFPPSLRALELHSSHCFTDKWTLLSALADQAPQLEVLRVDSVGVEGLGQVARLRQLVHLDACVWSSDMVDAYVQAIRQLPRLRSISLSRVIMGDDTNGLSLLSAWQLIDRTLEAVPQLEHFTTPAFADYDGTGQYTSTLRRLASMERLRSLVLLIGVRWDVLDSVILPALSERGLLEVGEHG